MDYELALKELAGKLRPLFLNNKTPSDLKAAFENSFCLIQDLINNFPDEEVGVVLEAAPPFIEHGYDYSVSLIVQLPVEEEFLQLQIDIEYPPTSDKPITFEHLANWWFSIDGSNFKEWYKKEVLANTFWEYLPQSDPVITIDIDET